MKEMSKTEWCKRFLKGLQGKVQSFKETCRGTAPTGQTGRTLSMGFSVGTTGPAPSRLLPQVALFCAALLFFCPDSNADEGKNYLGGFELGYKHQYLEPDFIEKAYVETTGMNIVQFKWTPEKAGWMQGNGFLQALRPELSYEFTPGNDAKQDQLVEMNESDEAGWERFVADLKIDFGQWLFNGEGHHYLASYYDEQSFLVTVQSKKD